MTDAQYESEQDKEDRIAYINEGDKWLSEKLGKEPRDELIDLLNELEGRE